MRFFTSRPFLASASVVAAAFLLSPTRVTAGGSNNDASLDQPFTSSFAKLIHAPCVTLFHRNGRIGCGTEDRSYNVGQLQYYEGKAPDTANPYVAVLEDYALTLYLDELVQARKKDGLLQGVLVLNSTASDGNSNNQASNNDGDSSHSFYSPESRLPQGYGSPSANLNYGNAQYAWNPKGAGLLQEDYYGVPVSYVVDSTVSASLRQEAQAKSADAAIVAEFNYYMGPDQVNSLDCLQWKNVATNEWAPKCLPLGGNSVWATPGSPLNPNSRNSNSNNNNNNNNKKSRSVVMLAANMDSTSMFHDLSPGANSAASNILTVMMAAKLIGANLKDAVLDNFPHRIVLALFQGETYGFIGSRAFFKDVAYPGFSCRGQLVHPTPNANNVDAYEYACLYPLRPSLEFANLGQIAGMLAVDQLGHMVGDGLLYVHANKNNDNFGAFLTNILMYAGTSSVTVAQSSTSNNNNNNGYAYPPSPLTSLLSLSAGNVGGAVLTGYDYAFTNKIPYHSFRDSASNFQFNYQAVAAAATLAARAVVAAAYDDGSYDYQTAAAYAQGVIPELSYNDESLLQLADCLLYSGGKCDLIQQYSSMEMANLRSHTGVNLGSGSAFPSPPSYYVGVYNSYYGQPFVQVGDKLYGSYDGNAFGKTKTDAVAMMPRQLEAALAGLLHDYLGRGSINNNNNNNNNNNQQQQELVSCHKLSDCDAADYCIASADVAVCTGSQQCVCRRAHYHVALDEALIPAVGRSTGYFEWNQDNDAGISAVYAEPYWSNSVGVRVYRDAGYLPGLITLAVGLVLAVVSAFGAFVLRVGLKKEKLY